MQQASIQSYANDDDGQEQLLGKMIRLIEQDLSEPYSIYTYRFFVHTWPSLSFNYFTSEGELTGCIFGKIQPHPKSGIDRRGYIGMLAVAPLHRRKGIAKQLVLSLMQQMRQQGEAQEIVLETECSNKAALALYTSLGFYKAKYLPKYYFNGTDAIRLKFIF